jgi:hypothetical protein
MRTRHNPSDRDYTGREGSDIKDRGKIRALTATPVNV